MRTQPPTSIRSASSAIDQRVPSMMGGKDHCQAVLPATGMSAIQSTKLWFRKSSADVGSSSTTIEASATSARASRTSWRCPPDISRNGRCARSAKPKSTKRLLGSLQINMGRLR